jgi:hypothetical protein
MPAARQVTDDWGSPVAESGVPLGYDVGAAPETLDA